MKKTYMNPTLLITQIGTEKLIAETLNQYEEGGNGVLVKGDRGADRSNRGSRSDYNVWNDDWSK